MSTVLAPLPGTRPGSHAARPVETAQPLLGGLRWVGQVVSWLLILGFAAVLAAVVVAPRIGGATPYTVLTGSMAPDMPPGTLVVAKPVDQDQLGIGTVVTYQLRSDEPAVVTHRIVATRTNLLGETEYQTQGDANPVPDQDWVRYQQIRGEKWYSIPVLGRVNVLITGHARQLATYGVAGALVLYAGAMFLGGQRDRRGRRRA